ncbi:adhesion G-protein coupled receptor G6-like isoform X1 [Acropora muricata]|uniref:adhesion G-protein coupled receptor G6-like isoform X1 n=1 Tax=Acropora muricata TaxID=159855 RepID=UPI0034E4DD61
MLYIQNEKWLASCMLILHSMFHLSGLQGQAFVQYTYKNEMISGKKLQKKCEETKEDGARINDTTSLQNALRNITAGKEYWTGLSWQPLRRDDFFWYKNTSLSTSVEESLINLTNRWICFSVKRNEPSLNPQNCDEMNHILCEGNNGDWFSSLRNSTTKKWNANQLQNACKNISGTVPKFNNILELKSKMNCSFPAKNRTHWTALSWNIKHHFCWNQNASSPAPFSNVCIPNVTKCNSWFCFVLRQGEPRMVAKRCYKKNNYICEKKFPSRTTSYTSNSELDTSITMEQQSLETAMTSSSLTSSSWLSLTSLSSLSTSSSLLPSSSPSSLSSSSLLSSPTTTINKTPAATLLETSPTSTVNLGTGFPTSSISRETTFTWLSDKNTTSPINSKESSTASPSIESSSGSNRREKLQHEAIEKLKILNFTHKNSLQNAVTVIQNLFDDLKDTVEEGKGTVNVLAATEQLESFAFKYAMVHFTENQSGIFSEKNYDMKIQRLAANNTDPLVFYVNNTTQQFKKNRVGIELPPEVLKGKDISIFIIYHDISQFVPEFPALGLRSRIIAAKVYPTPQGTLQENVTISFNGSDKKEVEKPHCMFWNFTIKSAVNGSWSTKGCSLVKSNDNETICACNHLTNFAVLMQVGELKKQITPEHLVAMEIITYVGCALSLTAEVLTVIAYCTLTDFKQEQMQIRLNLVVALAAAQIAFLSGIDALEPKGLCVFVAALIHYFYLVGFAWMFFEGVYLYLMVVKVFNTEIRLRAFYSAAWGCPAGIVVLSLVLAACQEGGLHSYIHGAFCWVSFSNNLIWTFVAPVLLVSVANTVLLSLVIREILKMQSDRASNVESLRQAAKACVVLSPLLGMTWVFGILSVTNAGLVFQYIFTILNSLQGFFILLLHIVRNADVRAEFRRKKKMWFEIRGRVADLHSSDKWRSKTIRSDLFGLNEITPDQQKQKTSHIIQEPLTSEVYN